MGKKKEYRCTQYNIYLEFQLTFNYTEYQLFIYSFVYKKFNIYLCSVKKKFKPTLNQKCINH